VALEVAFSPLDLTVLKKLAQTGGPRRFHQAEFLVYGGGIRAPLLHFCGNWIATIPGMDLRKTIAELYEEKAKLDNVIASLEQLAESSAPVSITTHRRGRKFMSPEERREVSERMRRYWAGRKAAGEPRVMTAASAA